MKIDKLRQDLTRTVTLTLGAILILAAGFMYALPESGFTTLPDGSKIKLLAVTSGQEHHVRWKRFSLVNTIRESSKEFGPYIQPEATEINTTTSVDCTVFWVKRVFGTPNARGITALVSDENGKYDRIPQGPFSGGVMRDRMTPTSDGVVIGWPVPKSVLRGRTLELHLYARQDSSPGEPAEELISYSAPNAHYLEHGVTPAAPSSNTALNGYRVQLAAFTSGIRFTPPDAIVEMFRQRPGPREFVGTSVTLAVSGANAESHGLRVQQVRARSAGGVSYAPMYFVQTTSPKTLELAFSPVCGRDVWDLELTLADESSSDAQRKVVSSIATDDPGQGTPENGEEQLWFYQARNVAMPDGTNLTLQTRCGPMDENQLVFSAATAVEARQPLPVTKILDEKGASLPFIRDDSYSVRCYLSRHQKLSLELTQWPQATVRLQGTPDILLPDVKPAAKRPGEAG